MISLLVAKVCDLFNEYIPLTGEFRNVFVFISFGSLENKFVRK